MSDLETLKRKHPEWKKWPHKCFEFCMALQELVQQHETTIAEKGARIVELEAKLAEADAALDWYTDNAYLSLPTPEKVGLAADEAICRHRRNAARKKGAEHGE